MSRSNTTLLFRPLTEAHLALLHRWLNSAHVARWWHGEGGRSYQQIVAEYLPRIHHEVPTHSFIVLYENDPVGYVQTYLLEDYPEYSQHVQAGPNSAGLDLFIGEADYLHIGLGPRIIRQFLQEYVLPVMGARNCVSAPTRRRASST